MTPDADSHQDSADGAEPKSFWRSRAGATLIVSLGVAALLLGYEHRIHLFAGGGFSVLLLVGCVAMHFFMHGSHGSHGGHGGSGGHGGGDKS